MTGRAVRQLNRRPNLVFLRQLLADFGLIGRRLPIHVENLIAWPQNVLGVAIAVQSPFHLQRRCLEDKRHLVDLAVAGGATHAFVDVDAVIEIDVFSQPMHAHPVNGLIGAVALANGLQITRGVEQHRVAVHAGFRGRNARGGGALYARVTVAAIDTVIADVVLMTKLNGLLARYVLVRQIGRTRGPEDAGQRQTRQKQRRKDTESRNEVRAVIKNLGHGNFALWR